MTAKILDGKGISMEIRKKLKSRIEEFNSMNGKPLGLAAVYSGRDDSIAAYIKNKDRVCGEMGVKTMNHILPEKASMSEILELIKMLNEDTGVHGILIQLPLPKGLDTNVIFESLSMFKDVDGLSPVNRGRLYSGEKCIIPCTAKSIIRLIEYTEIDVCGKNAAVVGRSNIVGMPAAELLLQKDATVTICHSKTEDLRQYLKEADIVVSCAGIPGLIDANMIKEGAVIIDAGIRYVEGRLTGDVKYEEVLEAASWITPVPGGVGSMTTTMLIENTLEAAECS